MDDLWHEARVRPMAVKEAAEVAAWRYGGDWSVYDLSTSQPLLDNLSNYYAVVNGDKLIGFFCIGTEARIAGMNEDPAILDVGIGMNPKLVGRGNGARFGETVLEYLDVRQLDVTLRAVVQNWNERSLRLTRRLGFQDAGELIAGPGWSAGDLPSGPEAFKSRQDLIDPDSLETRTVESPMN